MEGIVIKLEGLSVNYQIDPRVTAQAFKSALFKTLTMDLFVTAFIQGLKLVRYIKDFHSSRRRSFSKDMTRLFTRAVAQNKNS